MSQGTKIPHRRVKALLKILYTLILLGRVNDIEILPINLHGLCKDFVYPINVPEVMAGNASKLFVRRGTKSNIGQVRLPPNVYIRFLHE